MYEGLLLGPPAVARYYPSGGRGVERGRAWLRCPPKRERTGGMAGLPGALPLPRAGLRMKGRSAIGAPPVIPRKARPQDHIQPPMGCPTRRPSPKSFARLLPFQYPFQDPPGLHGIKLEHQTGLPRASGSRNGTANPPKYPRPLIDPPGGRWQTARFFCQGSRVFE